MIEIECSLCGGEGVIEYEITGETIICPECRGDGFITIPEGVETDDRRTTKL